MKKSLVSIALLLIAASFLAGCPAAFVAGGVAAGAGGVAYAMGELKILIDRDVHAIYEASRAALAKLEIKVVEGEKDALSALIIGRGAGDKKITLKIKRAEGHLSELSIRVGTFGDEAMSQAIYDEIRKHLDK